MAFHKPHMPFLLGVPPIKKDVYTTKKLLEVYKEGATDFVAATTEKCYTEILRAIYRGHIEPLEIVLAIWDSETMSRVVSGIQTYFPTVHITWISEKGILRVEMNSLQDLVPS